MANVLTLGSTDTPPGDELTCTSRATGDRGVQTSRRVIWAAKAVQLSADLVAVISAMFTAFLLRQSLLGEVPPDAGGAYLLLGTVSLPIWAGMLMRARLYSHARTVGRLEEFRRVVNATLSSLGAMAIVAFVLKVDVARGWLALTAVLAIAAIALVRSILRRRFARLRCQGHLLEPVILVGANVEALAMCSMLVSEPGLGYRVLGFVDDEAATGTSLLEDQLVLAPVAETITAARATGATGVIIITSAVSAETSNQLTRQLTSAGLHVELSSSLCDIATGRLFVRPLGRFPVVHVEPTRRDGWRGRAKRAFDLTAAVAIGIVGAPVLALSAIAIKLGSRGPVFFRQLRVGREGRPFEVLKLRTMVAGAEGLEAGLRERNEAHEPIFKMRSDPRVTRVGRALRALSIDEIPQLWNVLRGDMSLVGPRPALPREVPLWSPALHGRLAVRPGLTGMWQVSGGSRWHSFDEYSRLDLYYVDNWSIWTDLAILAKTVPAVLFNRSNH